MSDLKKQIDKGASKIEILCLLLVSRSGKRYPHDDKTARILPYFVLSLPIVIAFSLCPAALLLPSQGAQGETDHQPGVKHVYLFHLMRCSSGVFN
jgi:hypothetical protein